MNEIKYKNLIVTQYIFTIPETDYTSLFYLHNGTGRDQYFLRCYIMWEPLTYTVLFWDLIWEIVCRQEKGQMNRAGTEPGSPEHVTRAP